MNLLDESFEKREEPKGKTAKTIVLIAIILVIIAIFAIIGYMAYIKNNTIRSTVDGQMKNELKDLLIVEVNGSKTTLAKNPDIEQDMPIYVPIKKIAPYLGYESYSGEYSDKSESRSKCYVESNNEVANFELGSNKIYKLDKTKQSTANYEYVYSKNPIKSFDGELYATIEAVEKAFNVSFTYDSSKKTITVYTLPYLVEAYSPRVLDYGYSKISETFANQKAVLKNLIVVKKDEKTLGVIDTKGNKVLEDKYEAIEYLPNIGNGQDFLVTSNKKVGVISSNKETKIDIIYDSLELLDIDAGLYLAKRDNKYGVLDVRGNIKIHIENDEIGIDSSKFAENGIKNRYIIAGRLIPARNDKLWGLYDTNGQLVVDYEYDSLGYVANTNRNALNLLVIPDYNVVVACKDKKYILLSSTGRKLFEGVIADNIYMQISGGEKKYYIDANGQIIDAIQYLDSIGISKDSKPTQGQTETNSQEQEKDQQNQNQQTNDEEANNNNEQQENNNEEQNENQENNNEGQNEEQRNDNEVQNEEQENNNEEQNNNDQENGQ